MGGITMIRGIPVLTDFLDEIAMASVAPLASRRSYTVKAHDAAETVLAGHVGMSEALDAHEAAEGHATIYDDDDGEPACMAEFGNMGACECHRCNKCEECGGALTHLDDMTVQCVPCCKELGCYEKPNESRRETEVNRQENG